MLLLLCVSTLGIIYREVTAQGECTDVRGRLISHGQHYVPGPNTCSLCICDNGLAKYCKAVLCSQPQDCRSFRVGNTCCEFICLDDVVKPAETSDANVRFAAGGAAFVVLLTVMFVVYRIRKQKQRRTPHADDQRSLASIGYISGSMAYVGGTCETGLAGWKPGYMPRGEAPPPYDEAVAQARAEAMIRMSETAFRGYVAAAPTAEALSRPDELCPGHAYVNVPRPLTQMPNPSTCYNAPLLQAVHSSEGRDVSMMPHHVLSHNVGFPSSIRLTGSLGAISNRGLLSLLQRSPPEPERPHNVPGFYPRAHTELHRTIPRISTALDTTLLDSSLAGFTRADRALQGDVRRSFHKPGDARPGPGDARGLNDTGRSMPRNLNLASCSTPEHRLEQTRARAHSDDCQTASEARPTSCEARPKSSEARPTSCEARPKSGEARPKVGELRAKVGKQEPLPAPPSLPLTVDKPSCECSYTSAAGAGPAAGAGAEDGGDEGDEGDDGEGEEGDDYRSECANCKSAGGSRWVLEEGWVEAADGGTQTLQRRAPPPAPPPPAAATLPQPVTRPSRAAMGPPANWDNWFSAIPDSDSESEEE